MIISRNCKRPELLKDYIEVILENEYNLESDQIKDLPIKRDGIVIGKLEWADKDYMYGVVFSGPSLFCHTDSNFTYDVEVERKNKSLNIRRYLDIDWDMK